MSFAKYTEKIKEGDIVIIYLNHDNMHSLKVTRGQTHQTRFGALKHTDLIGARFGSKIICNKGWLYVLYPTPELWTLAVPHRTQILYSTDISMIILQLDLKPGAVVVEAGTGSGSLSHAIIEAVMPTGHLYTFEFHQERAEKAEEEFREHGLTDYVTVACRDVCEKGFELDGVADAVFLDLPSPWECVEGAKQALKKSGGRVCMFSPCIEQVQRSCDCLRQNGFHEVNTMECLVRNFTVKSVCLSVPDLGHGDNICSEKQSKHFKADSVTETEADKKNAEIKETLEDKCGSDKFSFASASPPINVQGHTGFLTFASLYPRV